MMMILLNPCLFCPVWGISYARLSNVATDVKLSAFLNCKSGAISHITTTILFFPITTRRATYQPVTQEYQNLKDKKIFCYLERRDKSKAEIHCFFTQPVYSTGKESYTILSLSIN
uniref:Secreted protein n=1 Tax=Anguilla anguilla TaxID=7936 RepID=A0A0E9XID5_ANGAN